MNRRYRVGFRVLYVLVLLLSVSVGQVRADPIDYPVGPPLPQQPVHPIHKLEPSPVGGISALAVTAAPPLKVITDPTLDMRVLVIIDSVIQVGGDLTIPMVLTR